MDLSLSRSANSDASAMRNTESSSSKVTRVTHIIISSATQISRLKKMEHKPEENSKYHYRRPKRNVRLPSYDAIQDQIKMKQTGLPSKTTTRRRALSLATVKQNVPILVHRRTRNVTNHRGYKNNTAERMDEKRNPTLAPGSRKP